MNDESDSPNSDNMVENLENTKDDKKNSSTYVRFTKEFQDALLSMLTELSAKIIILENRINILEEEDE